jgi:BirA family biotin operon repressor/biotin-[acetyl-CoA-carboxylase] ligase
MEPEIKKLRNVKLGEPLIHLHSVDSTNNYAWLIHKEKATEGTVILADHQQKGKGQGGSHWISDHNSNLLFSILLKPDFIPAERQYYLSMSISGGLADFVASIAGASAIKWPNDILLNMKKVAGVLIENTIMGDMLNTSVIGIGLNVNQREFPQDLPNPVSLSLATGKEYNLDETLKELLAYLSISVDQLYGGRLDLVRTTYLNHLWRLNEWALFTDDSGRFEGRIEDVADSGELMVTRRSGEVKRYGFKEIRFEE